MQYWTIFYFFLGYLDLFLFVLTLLEALDMNGQENIHQEELAYEDYLDKVKQRDMAFLGSHHVNH